MNQKSEKLKNMAKRIFGTFAILAICALQMKAQEKKSLSVGDDAPVLKYSKWIQGTNPITAIDPDKTYVIEFWATWCGPCIAAMPHLSELSKKYAGKIDFIGCNVWENLHGGNKDQETYLPKVTKFVQDQFKLGRLTYNVITDNTAEYMGNNWLKAAGIDGIPSSFVVQKGKIAWIGHPVYLDSILAAVNSGTYNVQAEKQKYEDQEKKMAEMQAGFNAAIKLYKDAEAAKEYDKALQLADQAIAKFPDNKYMFTTDKFMMLLRYYGEEKAIAYGLELQRNNLTGQVLIGTLMTTENLSPSVIEFCITAVKKWDDGKNPKLLDILADFQARGGFYKDAAETQKKTVELAKKLKTDPQWGPIMTDGVISDYQKKADEYEKKADKKN
ncbi:redoxin family protein [Pedobacter sp.]|jgi:thiol-disulfide isomerase/thioredoxin|uniref:redoxin family protein n=1 Tax=Pedobacter sp. TaxID=1411316 RepID=UPI002CE52EE7|nr:redoxin family protein [Pedobacter sp.]HWW43193.1 redoxin family protein [Pedobacter sp.]